MVKFFLGALTGTLAAPILLHKCMLKQPPGSEIREWYSDSLEMLLNYMKAKNAVLQMEIETLEAAYPDKFRKDES